MVAMVRDGNGDYSNRPVWVMGKSTIYSAVNSLSVSLYGTSLYSATFCISFKLSLLLLLTEVKI